MSRPNATPLWKRLQSRLTRFVARRALGTVTRVATTEPVVALTFDDGPHPIITPQVAAVLEAHGARGTFFMVGEAAARHPELVRRLAQADHALGNHSHTHPSFPTVSSAVRRREMQACAAALRPHGQMLFRPPYGHQTLASRWDAGRLGYRVVTWDVVAVDWLDHSAEAIRERVTRAVRPGSIVLFHDALRDAVDPRFGDRAPMVAALHGILTDIAGRLRCVTVPELLQLGQPHYEHWQREGDPTWLSQLQRVPMPPAEPVRG